MSVSTAPPVADGRRTLGANRQPPVRAVRADGRRRVPVVGGRVGGDAGMAAVVARPSTRTAP
ncbi:hypothetical protein [Micromonospora coxensis]|uniref:Uncharacterized protein n=1 Tax=Micromonospora coxensis TaxID=356852 RepID=A0A1C5I718_9ACTN|nr:hypothetical protein [Micromonospora coxensis]SCG53935.1 hypothetical protein GA0070614_2309 [Micromonospora coxensis]